MADNTGIEWCDATWNPIRGCSRVSEGCRHCYAELIASRFSDDGQPYAGLATRDPPRWTNVVRDVPGALIQPMLWTRPRKIFVNSMSDLFHEGLPLQIIGRCFAVMALCPWHIFIVVTKRAARMRELIATDSWLYETIYGQMEWLAANHPEVKAKYSSHPYRFAFPNGMPWPLPNVWKIVSVESQKETHRVRDLLHTPAAKRGVSVEPLLGPIDLTEIPHENGRSEHYYHALDGYVIDGSQSETPRLDWVIVGGESGPGARPMHPDWARALRDQCRDAHVAFFFKQWGAWVECSHQERDADFICNDPELLVNDPKLNVVPMRRTRKQNAGRELDGRTHSEFPQ